MIRMHPVSLGWLKRINVVDYKQLGDSPTPTAVLGEDEIYPDDREPRNEPIEKLCALLEKNEWLDF